MANNQERVRIWNTFFKLAWDEAKSVFETVNKCSSKDTFAPLGGTLSEDEIHIVAALVMCCLSIEARANHLIDELQEEGKFSSEVADAVRWLPAKQKWFFLPTLAGVSSNLSSSRSPHQAVAQLCDLRNDLMHVRYDKLKSRLPKPELMLSYFKTFVEAMEDMNVVLNRHSKPDPDVLKIGEFHCT